MPFAIGDFVQVNLPTEEFSYSFAGIIEEVAEPTGAPPSRGHTWAGEGDEQDVLIRFKDETSAWVSEEYVIKIDEMVYMGMENTPDTFGLDNMQDFLASIHPLLHQPAPASDVPPVLVPPPKKEGIGIGWIVVLLLIFIS